MHAISYTKQNLHRDIPAYQDVFGQITKTLEEDRYRADLITDLIMKERVYQRTQKEIVGVLLGDYRRRLTYLAILGPALWHPQKIQEQMKFLSLLKSDPELNLYISEQLEATEKEAANYVKNILSWKTWCKSMQEKGRKCHDQAA